MVYPILTTKYPMWPPHYQFRYNYNKRGRHFIGAVCRYGQLIQYGKNVLVIPISIANTLPPFTAHDSINNFIYYHIDKARSYSKKMQEIYELRVI